jgi:1-phosphofructokinase family hexose kinase
MILAAGLSPVWQQILVFDAIVPGEVNRAREAVWCSSGKSLNAGRAAWALGAECHTLSTIGGPTGQAVRAEWARDRIPTTWIETLAPTRVCTTLIERHTGRITELVENAPPITAAELEQFETQFRTLMQQATCLLLSGSLPDVSGLGPPTDLWRRLLMADGTGPPSRSDLHRRLLLDIRGPDLWNALPCRPLLVKPNRSELAVTLGRPLETEQDVIAGMQTLNAAGAEWVLVTQGAGPVLLTSQTEVMRFQPQPVPVVNPIGCGDCLAGGIAAGLEAGLDLPDAVPVGLAAAAENCGHLLPARLQRRFGQSAQRSDT